MNTYAPPKDVLSNAWWCCYCLCGGCGLGPLASPLAATSCKYGICKQTCETANCLGNTTGEGFCNLFHRWFCCNCECKCPCRGSPGCLCCGCSLGRGCVDDWKKGCFDIWTCHLACCRPEPWWCCYCCCSGCGMSELQQDSALIYSSNKCGFCRSTLESTMPCGTKDGCCQSVHICCWWYTQCQLPPSADTPCCACCGHGGRAAAVGFGNSAVPSQQVMGNASA